MGPCKAISYEFTEKLVKVNFRASYLHGVFPKPCIMNVAHPNNTLLVVQENI